MPGRPAIDSPPALNPPAKGEVAKIADTASVEPSQITEPNYNSGAFHDRIGRYFKLGARVQF